MKTKLSVQERLVLGMILPVKSSFETLKVVTKLQDTIGFSDEEHALLDFKYEGEKYIDESTGKEKIVPSGSIHYEKNVPEKEMDIGEKATDIIVKSLKELDKNEQLMMQHKSLYEKFVLNNTEV